MKKILLFAPSFDPAFKGGGPIKSLKNLAEFLSHNYDVYVFTQNVDIDKTILKDIVSDKWIKKDNYNIFYSSSSKYLYNLTEIFKFNGCFDLVYFNSFFNPKFTLIPFLMFGKKFKILMAPRGEFCNEALKQKKFKKKIFLFFVKIFFKSYFNKVFWHFTSQKELLESKGNLNAIIDNYFISENLVDTPKFLSKHNNKIEDKIKKIDKKLNIVFLSRISPIKNLEYCLNVLKKVNSDIRFDIYGPNEDLYYWGKCQQIINDLPDNIKVNYLGPLTQDMVISTLKSYDLFFLPTKGENFGHVIFEALSAGLILLISNNTPWSNLEKHGIGHDISLDNFEYFVECIEQYANMNNNEVERLKAKSYSFIDKYLSEDKSHQNTDLMIKSIINR